MKSNRYYLTINQACELFGFECPDHIKSNEGLSRINGGQYDIIRQGSNDGTLMFTHELIGLAIENLLNKSSYYKDDDLDGLTDITYEVGLISIATVYGKVTVPVGKINGQRQRVRIPVKTNLIKTQSNERKTKIIS